MTAPTVLPTRDPGVTDAQWARIVADLTRRGFLAGTAAAALALAGCAGGTGPAAPGAPSGDRRAVSTPQGDYDIPVDPQRVVAIDSRVDLEPAVALGLPLIGYTNRTAQPWIPLPDGVPLLSQIPDVEQILGLEPDLIICTKLEQESEFWPISRLQEVAPVLPVEYSLTWQENLRRIAGWLGRPDAAETAIGEYDAAVADVRARHADAISGSTVIGVTYSPEEGRLWGTSLQGVEFEQPAGAVLRDLGGRTLDTALFADDTSLAMENIEVLEAADAILFADSREDPLLDRLRTQPLWQQLPAVRAGRVAVQYGDTYFGGGYTSAYVLQGWDDTFATLA